MNIIYIADSKIPSDQANVVNKVKMVNAFAQNGNNVLFIMIQEGKLYFRVKNYIRKQYDIHNKFKLILLPSINKKTLMISEYFAVLLSKLAYRYDVVVTRSLRIARIANKIGLKVIYDSHRPAGFKDHESINSKELEKKVLLHSNTIRVISTTESGREYFRSVYGEDVYKKTRVARNGADVYELNEKISVNRNYRLHAGYFGQLYDGKGMEVISELILRNPAVFFHIAGGPEKDKNYWKNILDGCENVCFYGYLDQKSIISLRNSCDILLAPYKEIVMIAGGSRQINTFSSPIKIFEYMASKKAIIASRNPEIMEVLEHNRNAILVDNGDIKSWNKKLQLLSNNSSLRGKLANEAYRDFVKNYTWKKRAEIFTEDLIG